MERPEPDLGSLISNLSLYQGELLPGFYEDWIVLERERIRGVFDTKMEQLLGNLVAAERWTVAGLDFLELSMRVTDGADAAAGQQRALTEAVLSRGLHLDDSEESKTMRVMKCLAGLK